jgi:hypothetical protein
MKTPSRSPDRHTFQKQGYLERCEKESKEPSEDYLKMFENILKQHDTKFDDPESRKYNLEYDLLTTDWILEKVRASESYAQNLYAAMCNNEFTKREMWPLLKEQKWGCSWRYAGGIIADMRQEGDYIDWYCSGIRNEGFDNPVDITMLTEEEILRKSVVDRYVSESVVTDEIEEDLYKLGWIVVKYNGDE